MEYYANQNDYRSYLEHHGIMGMKWGVRRYQNSDGSLTSAGRSRYGYSEKRVKKQEAKAAKKQFKKDYKEYREKKNEIRSKTYDQEYKNLGLAERQKRLESRELDPWLYETGKHRDKVVRERARIVDEMEALESVLEANVETKTREKLMKKYGSQKLSAFEAKESRNGQIATGAALAAMGAMTFAVLKSK